MPSNRKLFLNGTTVMVSFRTEEGLPFVPVTFINEIFWSNLAKAQQLYGQRLCTFAVESNQVHMILLVDNPESVYKFVGYLKQETSHAINRFLGRKRKTVWVDGYDSPTLLDLKTFLKEYSYCLLNPVKDRLIDSMEHYPGVSAWNMLQSRQSTRECMVIARDSIPLLSHPHQPWKDDQAVMEFLASQNPKKATLEVALYDWKKCFPESSELTDDQAHQLLLGEIERFLEELKVVFAGKPPVSSDPRRLTHQSMLRPYMPKKFGKKMICLASDKLLRIPFIEAFKALSILADEVLLAWRKGDTSRKFPSGLFPPCMPMLSNMAPGAFI